MTAGVRDGRTMPPAGTVLLLASLVSGVILLVALAEPAGIVLFASYAGIGAFLAVRRPTNSIGWLLMMIGWGLGFGNIRVEASIEALMAGDLTTVQSFATWANGCGWNFAFLGFFCISLTFPGGRWPTGRARWPSLVGLGAIVILVAIATFGPTMSIFLDPTEVTMEVPNPFVIAPGAPLWSAVPGPNELGTATFAIVVVGFIGLFVRYRRSIGVERLQYRWLVAAVALIALSTLLWAIAVLVLEQSQGGLFLLTVVVAYPALPVAIAVAILRYRLYELDRIVSRTIAYATVTVILAGIFGGGVLILSSVLSSFAQGESLAVAASTLAACVALQPVLRRVRRNVDRRFDRARYDAEATLIAFRDRVRSETDVDAVTTDLASTARSAVAPTSTSLWLRTRSAGR